MVFLQKKRRKGKLFRILHWITFILTIFQKELAKNSYSTFSDRFSMTWAAASPIKTKIFHRRCLAPSARSQGQTSHENPSEKVEYLFLASSFWKMVKINVIQCKILNNFPFLRFFCKKTKSYPTYDGDMFAHYVHANKDVTQFLPIIEFNPSR